MDIVKKNLVSIICGVVALLALVAVFVWPLDGYFDSLSAKAKQRAEQQGKVSGLLTKSRSLPGFSLSGVGGSSAGGGEVAKLTKFPSNEVIAKGEKAQKKVKEESQAVYDLAVKLNKGEHTLTVPDSLPTPSNTVALNFPRLISDAYTQLRKDLAAGVPPTPEERKLREAAIWEELKKKLVYLDDGRLANEAQVMGEFDERRAKLPEQMKEEMATKYKVYMDSTNVLRPSAALSAEGGKAAEVMTIWWSQVSYWVTQDVTNAIKEANASAKNVTDAPVKNLIALNIQEDFFPSLAGRTVPTQAAAGDAAGGDAAALAPAGGGAPDPTILVATDAGPGAQEMTRRASNNLYDVVHFSMTVDVEADRVAEFLKSLGTNRFITVTRMEMNPVDSQVKQILGYVYGTKPVVTLDLDCEAVLMRDWTKDFMPDVLKRGLGIPTAPAAPAAGGGATGDASDVGR